MKKSASLLLGLLISISMIPAVVSQDQEQQVSVQAIVLEVPHYPPSVLIVSPENVAVIPNIWFNITVVVYDNEMNLENIYLMAYENTLDNTASDNIRSHYTWVASKSTGAWQFSCPLGATYIDSGNSSVQENPAENTYIATFRVKLAKIAAPGTWDLYARAIDNAGLDNYRENANAVMVQVYLEMSLSTYTLTFSGYKGQSVYAAQSPMTVTVSSNRNFTIRVKAAGDFTSGGNTIPASAAKAIGENTVSLSTTYENVWRNVSYGEGVQRQIQWRLDIPSDAVAGSYTNTFYVRVETLVTPPAPPGPINLVQNPSFEDTTFWLFSPPYSTRSSDRARTGSYSAKQTQLGTSYGSFVTSDNITAFTPGATYYLEGYYYLVNPGGGASPDNYRLFFRIRWYPFWENDSGFVQTPGAGFTPTAFDSWVKVSHTIVAPENAVRARVYITAMRTSTAVPSTDVFWDDIWLATQPP